jgi:hypothetical protein
VDGDEPVSKPPDDVRVPLLSRRTDFPGGGFRVDLIQNPERNWPPCRVYWGSHGCARPLGHEGDHWCDCCDCDEHPEEPGCVAGPPYYGPETTFYGEGTENWSPATMEIEIK